MRRVAMVAALVLFTTTVRSGEAGDAGVTERASTIVATTTSTTVSTTVAPEDPHWLESATNEWAAGLERLAAQERASRAKKRTEEATKATRTGAGASGSAVVTSDDAFWRRLSQCENPDGQAYGGYFQFTDPGTARKAGYVPGSSYEAQLAAARRWAAMIHPNEGTTAGWPHCWWVALKSG